MALSDAAEGRSAPRRLPRLQVVSAWNDPADATVWSGTVNSLLHELHELGASAEPGYGDCTPWAPAVGLVRGWMAASGRLSDTWALRPEMRLLTAVHAAARRLRPVAGVDGSVLPVGALGRPVRHPYATWCDMAPAQIADAQGRFASSFGYGGASRRDLEAVLRQQVRTIAKADACLAVSRWAGDSLSQDHGVPPHRVHVTGAGRNLVMDPPARRHWDTPRYLFVGNDWGRKNGDGLVRAFVRLRAEIPDAELHMVGRGHPPVSEDGVTMHGPLSFADTQQRQRLIELFHRATCLAVPSWLEPFGIVYVEAGSVGLPCVAGTAGGTATSVGAGGLRVDPADDARLLGALRELADPTRARRLGRLAQEWSTRFTWRRCAERVVRAFCPGLAAEAGLAEFL